jgi:hypothetical protein
VGDWLSKHLRGEQKASRRRWRGRFEFDSPTSICVCFDSVVDSEVGSAVERSFDSGQLERQD